MPDFTDRDVNELEELESFIQSRAYAYFLAILEGQRKAAVKDCHTALSRKEDRIAGEHLARSRQLDEIPFLIKDRIAALNTKINATK